MIGLKASPGGIIHSAAPVQLQLAAASKCRFANRDEFGNERGISDGVDATEAEGECESLLSLSFSSTGSDEPNVNDDNGDEGQEVDRANRDVVTFFKQFSSLLGGNHLLQPIAVLQTRYQALQYKIDKQAKTKSLKEWFRDHSSGPANEPSKSSDIVVPDEIAAEWGLRPLHSSGRFPLTRSEWETLKGEVGGKDLLLDVCGEYKLSATNAVQFRTKKAAQKSAVLNLLLVMDLGYLPDHPKDNGQLDFDAGASTSMNIESEPLMSKERFRLHSFKCFGSAKNPEGGFLSVRNPCMVRCLVSIKDLKCSDPGRCFIEASSKQYQQEDSIRDTSEKLTSALMERGATADDIESVLLEMKQHRPTIAYEITVPKWATARMESTMYLFELEFSFYREDGARVTLSEGMGLDTSAATRIGILCGHDLHGGSKFRALCADFALALTVDAIGSNCHVRMCSRTKITLSEMKMQIEATHGKMTLEDEESPIVLARCFNIILFNHCKTYGRGPKLDWRDLLKHVERENHEADSRAYLFLPLRRIPNDEKDSDLEIDWRVVWDVVQHKATPVHQARKTVTCISSVSFFIAGVSWAPAVPLLVAKCCLYWRSWNGGLRLFVACMGNAEIRVALITLLLPLLLCAIGVLTAANATKVNSAPLRNRFLIQPVGLRGRMFIVKNDDRSRPATAFSPLLPHDAIKQIPDHVELKLRKLHVDPSKITYVKYYRQLWKNDLKSKAKAWLCKLHDDPTKMKFVKRYFRHFWEFCVKFTRKYSTVLWDAAMAISGLFGVGGHIRYPLELLIPAQTLIGLQYTQEELTLFHQIFGKTPPSPRFFEPSHHNSISNILAARGLLVPELTFALPMPRDMLYLCQYAPIFMRKLERICTLECIGMRLKELQKNVERSLQIKNTFPVSAENMMTLVNKATSKSSTASLEAPTYRKEEQLEVLGDAILLFYIVLNLFAKCSSCEIKYVLDLFDENISNQVSNESLFKAAMQMGVHRLLHLENLSPTKAWRCIYKIGTEASIDMKPFENISRRCMSDALESLAGASYLIDRSGCMTIGLLNEMGPHLLSGEKVVDDSDFSSEWFPGKGTCQKEGYPFDSHDGWASELTIITGVLHQRHSILSKLQENGNTFCKLLAKFNERQREEIIRLQNDPVASLLIHCSLFDESFDEQELHPDTKGLEMFANLRDKIFHIGNAALQLSILSELCHTHPTSTSGDLHLMKVILLSNDTIAYIFVKNRLHECLFDSDSDAPVQLQGFMKESDLLGANEWANRGGWIIPGGPDEFKRRIEKYHGDDRCSELEEPRYQGLAAGKLWGRDRKLPVEATDELHFSMKCTVGALVLALGVSNAWVLLRPLFLELMLLSPDEYRTAYKGISPVVSTYKKGRK